MVGHGDAAADQQCQNAEHDAGDGSRAQALGGGASVLVLGRLGILGRSRGLPGLVHCLQGLGDGLEAGGDVRTINAVGLRRAGVLFHSVPRVARAAEPARVYFLCA